ncbi:mRNA decapping enzyme 2-like protein [Tomelloso virus]|uniref:mRNA decapping enzyme 2-like protein n=1 Tax=Tomelloso virus TaxID=2053981 RepID=A0A2H4T2T2_9VIRU|nr:mRNA decapping enzyme 2-like protein [Tomelloso virus]ATY70232.1 mRNA decapping enzyme 2-like protein [Tomelloso virus]
MEQIHVPCSVLEEIARKNQLYSYNYGENNNKLMSSMQKGYWQCIDNYNHYNNLKFKSFSYQMFKHLPNLKRHTRFGVFCKTFKRYIEYTRVLPTSGAIIISNNKILLVQALKSNRWSFPKGKIEDCDLDQMSCACREVYEETSLDIRKYINADDYCELVKDSQIQRLYFIRDAIPLEELQLTRLEPKTCGEIRKIEWVDIRVIIANQHSPEYVIIQPFINVLAQRINILDDDFDYYSNIL